MSFAPVTEQLAYLKKGFAEIIREEDLKERLTAAAKVDPQPELHLRADKTTQYQILAEVMAEAGKAGITRIGFVSDPNAN